MPAASFSILPVAATAADGLGITYTATNPGVDGDDITVTLIDSAGGAAEANATGADVTVLAPIAGKLATLILDAGAGEVAISADGIGSSYNGIRVSLIKRVTISSLALSVEAPSPRDFKVYMATDATTDVFATLSTALTGSNNDLDYTSVLEGAYGNLITVAYVAPTVAKTTTTVQVNNRAITVNLAGTIGTAALTTALTGSNNDLVYTAVMTGSATANGISVAYVKPETNSAVLSCSVTQAGAITVNLATNTDGVSQVETATAAGTVTVGGNASVTITAAGMTGSPLVLAVPVTAGAASAWAAEVRAYLTSDAAAANVRALFDIGGTTTAITLTANSKRANDGTLNIALATGTATGITTAASSANTTAGVATTTTTTAAQIKTLLEADTGAASIVTIANAAANDGTGTVTALAATNLTGGGVIAITSTAAQVKAAIDANRDAAALVTVANKSANDGTGVVAALASTALASGKHADCTSTVAQIVTAINALGATDNIITASGTGTTSTVVNANHSGSLAGGIDPASVRLGDIRQAIAEDEDSAALVTAVIDPKIEDYQPTTAQFDSAYAAPLALSGGKEPTIDANGNYDVANLVPGDVYALSLIGTWTGSAVVTLYAWSDNLQDYVAVPSGSWTANTSTTFALATGSDKIRLTATSAGSASIQVTITKLDQ